MLPKIYKISAVIFILFLSTLVQAQDYEITIKRDTIVTQKSRILRIVTVRTLPKFTLHFNGGYNTGAMELTSHNGGYSRDDF
ncbi:MAG: hypothetical protein JNK43_07100, partial [Ignavibacteria bacterium]|nr:hypothetical protein [Ignavibacteria bacterium]